MQACASGAGHWRRWNGAEWNRLELAKSGPFPRRSVVGSGFRRLIGGRGGCRQEGGAAAAMV
jgi:hypothetical protein